MLMFFWVYFLFSTLLNVLQWLYHFWEVLFMLLCTFQLIFYLGRSGMLRFIARILVFHMLIGLVFVIITEMLHGRISFTWELLLLLLSFLNGLILELMYISLIGSIKSSHIQLCGFDFLVLLSLLI